METVSGENPMKMTYRAVRAPRRAALRAPPVYAASVAAAATLLAACRARIYR